MSIHIFRLLRLRACRIAQRKAPLITSRTAHAQLTHSPTHSPAQSPRHSISRSEHPDNPKQKRADLQPIIGASGAPCFVDKNAVHGKNLGKHIVFRGFLLFFGQKRGFCAPSKQVSILCCLLTVFHVKQDLNPAIFLATKFFCLKTYKISLTEWNNDVIITLLLKI